MVWTRGANVGLGAVLAAVLALVSAGLVLCACENRGWSRIPTITVVGAADDPRRPVVAEAVEHWNRTFAGLGIPFRLGAITPLTGSVPDVELVAMSNGAWKQPHPRWPADVDALPGDLIVILSDASFISFTSREGARGLIAIKNAEHAPLSLPNVLRNVIAHELGHAVGLGHNADPTLLMCGRPAPCRPPVYESDTPRFFPLSPEEEEYLRVLYPPD